MDAATTPAAQVSVIIPAFNEQARIAATVAGARSLPGVGEIIVVDDGSSDATADEAVRAGATVIRARHRGKGGALHAGVAAAAGDLLLLLDADLGETAANAMPLVDPVAHETADMTVAILPAAAVSENARAKRVGGFGLALKGARIVLWLLTGRVFAAPLSGQRCLTRRLARELPWARGFGAEVGATVDAAALGARIVEVPCEFRHAATGRTWRGFLHRGRQLAAVLVTAVPRMLYPIGPTAAPAPSRRIRVAFWVWAALAVTAAAVHPWALAAVGVAAGCVVATLLALAANQALRLRRPNYLGCPIPAAGGLAFALGPLAASFALPGFRLVPHADAPLLAVAALATAAMAAVGFADDLWGSRTVSGLGGHLGALMRGRVTTGAIKAITGGLVGLGVGWFLSSSESLVESASIWLTLLNALVIALTANFVNLLDVRPGRAFKGFLLLAAIAVATERQAWITVVPIGLVALAFQPLDLGGRAMMGDVGANSLGVMAGIALAWALPPWGKLVWAAALVGIHLYSERRSINDFVARTPVLRWLDRLGRSDDNSYEPHPADTNE
jgi:hypothetical protein